MTKSTGKFSRDSLLPSILELESELFEREKDAMKGAEEKIHSAKLTGDALNENTIKELPILEEEERKKLLETENAKTEELRKKEERKLSEIEKRIENNRKRVLDFILNSIIPGWDGRYPE